MGIIPEPHQIFSVIVPVKKFELTKEQSIVQQLQDIGLLSWIDENITGYVCWGDPFHIDQDVILFHFSNKKEAMLFKLTWT